MGELLVFGVGYAESSLSLSVIAPFLGTLTNLSGESIAGSNSRFAVPGRTA